MARTALLTVGRFPAALTLARGLHGHGVRVIVADPMKRQLCSVSRAVTKTFQVAPPNTDIEGWERDILDIIERENVTDLIPTSEEVCHVANLAPRLPDTTRYVGPSAEWIAQWHDKLQFVNYAISRGVTAPSVYTTADGEARSLIRQTECVLKPRRGCSGTEVSFIPPGSTLPPPSQDMLLQRRVQGNHLYTLSWVDAGEVKATASYRGSTHSGTVAVGFQSAPTPFSVKQWIEQFVADTDVTGFLSFDFILDRSGIPWGIECNPRLSSGVHFIDEAWLGAAVMGEDMGAPSITPAGKRAQWSYSTLTEAYKHLFRFQIPELIRCLRDLFISRDAVWSWRDPLPFFLMTPLCWEFIWRSIRERIPIGDASQCDIAWHWFKPGFQQEFRREAPEQAAVMPRGNEREA
ncbi:MAG: ATP-grasp domain-containing protein [Luminiphilus sp.]